MLMTINFFLHNPPIGLFPLQPRQLPASTTLHTSTDWRLCPTTSGWTRWILPRPRPATRQVLGHARSLSSSHTSTRPWLSAQREYLLLLLRYRILALAFFLYCYESSCLLLFLLKLRSNETLFLFYLSFFLDPYTFLPYRSISAAIRGFNKHFFINLICHIA